MDYNKEKETSKLFQVLLIHGAQSFHFLLYHFVDVIDSFLSLFFFVFYFILLKNLWEKWNYQFPEIL